MRERNSFQTCHLCASSVSVTVSNNQNLIYQFVHFSKYTVGPRWSLQSQIQLTKVSDSVFIMINIVSWYLVCNWIINWKFSYLTPLLVLSNLKLAWWTLFHYGILTNMEPCLNRFELSVNNTPNECTTDECYTLSISNF